MNDALVLGTFDGLHKGHQSVINSVKNYNIHAITFKIPPKSVLNGKAELLMAYEDKVKALKDFGVCGVVALEFDDVCNMSCDDFLAFLYNKYRPSAIACGFNYRFGKNAKGNTEVLSEFCYDKKIDFFCCEETLINNTTLSSTFIRRLIKDGKMNIAEDLIYGGFRFEGEVIHGNERGRQIGFPTINQIYPELLVRPKFGVYKSITTVDGKEYQSITNVGIRPTYKTTVVMAETHIFNFSENIYGKTVKIRLKDFLREEIKFNSLKELKKQIENDVKSLTFEKI